MRKSIYAIAVLFCLLTGLSSCLEGDETDYSIYRDCAITAFSLKDISWEVTTKNKAGNDSTYTQTVTASAYHFTIDQMRGLIYNTDSLPAGTKVNKVLVNLTADGNAVYNKGTGDEMGMLQSDSIDFTKDVKATVYSISGEYSKAYTIRVNVHQVDPDSSQWFQNKVEWCGKELQTPKAATFGDKVAVFGIQDGKLMVTTANQGSMSWSSLEEVQGVTNAAKYDNVVAFQDILYMVDGDVLYVSEDAVSWTQMQTNAPIHQLFGCNSNNMFAVSDKSFLISNDGLAWNNITTENPEIIPNQNIFSYTVPTSTNQSIERTLTFGQITESTDTIASAWYLTNGNQDGYSNQWSYMYTTRDNNNWALPNLKNLVVLFYRKYLIAFGNECLNGGKITSFENMLVSKDWGLTWKDQANETLDIYPTLPAALKGNEQEFAAYVDKDHNIWIMFCGSGDIWCGYLNKMKFAE